ncbi:MAG: GGDEF domain-containing protein [Rhizobiaceae bacterium]
MGQDSLYQLLSILLLLVLAGGMGAIYGLDRSRHRSALFFSLSYLASAGGLLADLFGGAIPPGMLYYLTNAPFAASALLFAGALHGRGGMQWPWRPMALVTLATFAVSSWFLWAEPNLQARVVAMNAGALLLAALGFPALGAAGRINRVMVWLLAATCAQYAIRPALVLALPGSGLQHYIQSPLFVLFHLAMAFITLAFAGALFAAYGLDIAAMSASRSDSEHLPGLADQRGFDQQVQGALASAQGGGPQPVLIVLSLDHFAQIDALSGRQASNAVIRRMAYALEAGLACGAIAGRTGQAEFAVMLPRATLSMAWLWCEGMRAALAAPSEHLHAGQLPAFAASFGIAQAREGEPLQSLKNRAGLALGKAKSDGGNCVRTTELEQAAAFIGRRWR